MNAQYLPQIPLDWKQIDTVFLDMDGTLLDLHFDNYFWIEHLPKRYAELNDLTLDQALAYLNQHHETTHGTLNWYCLDHWEGIIQTDIVALKQEVAEKIQWRDKADEFLKFLRQLNKHVVLLTNAHQRSLNLKFAQLPLHEHFDDILISHSLQLPKEHPEFWNTLATQYPIHKERSLFIDDNVNVLKAAKAYGVGHLLLVQHPDSQRTPNAAHPEFVNLLSYRQIMA